jgi:hypothetical protein
MFGQYQYTFYVEYTYSDSIPCLSIRFFNIRFVSKHFVKLLGSNFKSIERQQQNIPPNLVILSLQKAVNYHLINTIPTTNLPLPSQLSLLTYSTVQ